MGEPDHPDPAQARDIEGRAEIVVFVDSFYTKVRKDAILAPIFALRVKDDEWQWHLNRMYDFWYLILFYEGSYGGNPLAKHTSLPLEPVHFDRWLTLFDESIDECFNGPVASKAKTLVVQIAAKFKDKLAERNPAFQKHTADP